LQFGAACKIVRTTEIKLKHTEINSFKTVLFSAKTKR